MEVQSERILVVDINELTEETRFGIAADLSDVSFRSEKTAHKVATKVADVIHKAQLSD